MALRPCGASMRCSRGVAGPAGPCGAAAHERKSPERGRWRAYQNNAHGSQSDGSKRGETASDEVVFRCRAVAPPSDANPRVRLDRSPSSSPTAAVTAGRVTRSAIWPSHRPGRALPVRGAAAAGYSTSYRRRERWSGCRLAEPFGHSRPRGHRRVRSPSIWTTFSPVTRRSGRADGTVRHTT